MGCVIPNEYQEVEYIESTGTQSIYTDIPAQLPIITSCDLMFTKSQDSYFFGTRGNDIRICTCGYYHEQWQWALGTYQLTRGILTNVRYKMDTILKNGSQVLTLNDSILSKSSYTISKETSGEGFGNFALFSYYNEDSKSFGLFTKARCYGARIWNGENKILGNFIPCYRKSDNEIGMYDTVSKQFFTNQGTGTFLKGNDVYHSNVFDLLKTKKKIIMNQPHVETLTGDVVSFTTDMKAPLKECKVSFMPVQEGSGDPSPTNVRNITGWNGVSIKNGNNTYSVDWTDDAGTIYGGYVDLVKGELVAEYFGFVADGVNVAVNRGYVQSNCYGGGIVYFSGRYSFPNGSRILSDWYCDKLKPVLGGSGVGVLVYPWAGSLYCVFYPFSKTAEETKTSAEAIEETNAWLQDNPTTVVYKLAEPITYQLTPQQLITLKGTNNIWSNSNGQTEVKFWTH